MTDGIYSLFEINRVRIKSEWEITKGTELAYSNLSHNDSCAWALYTDQKSNHETSYRKPDLIKESNLLSMKLIDEVNQPINRQ